MIRAFPNAASFTVLVALCGACTDDLGLPPLEFESERTLVGVASGEPMCGADLTFLDRHVELIEDRLGLSRASKIEIYIYQAPNIDPCTQSPLGCYKPGEDYIATAWQFVDHELVHAVTAEMRFPSLFWSEGVADLFRTEGTRINTTRDLLVEDLGVESDVDLVSAGHFSRFLVEEYGWESYRKIIRGESFASVVGADEDELVADYLEVAPYAYPPMSPCPFPEIPSVGERQWSERLEFSCESPDTTQFESVNSSGSDGAAIVRRLQLEAGRYELHQQGGHSVALVGCQTEELSVAPPLFSNGDVANQAEAEQTAPGKLYEADTPHTVNLTAGLYRFAVSSGTNDPTTIDLSIRAVD